MQRAGSHPRPVPPASSAGCLDMTVGICPFIAEALRIRCTAYAKGIEDEEKCPGHDTAFSLSDYPL